MNYKASIQKLSKILKDKGVIVKFGTFKDERMGGGYYNHKKAILVSDSQSNERQFIALAHEAIHWLQHSQMELGYSPFLYPQHLVKFVNYLFDNDIDISEHEFYHDLYEYGVNLYENGDVLKNGDDRFLREVEAFAISEKNPFLIYKLIEQFA